MALTLAENRKSQKIESSRTQKPDSTSAQCFLNWNTTYFSRIYIVSGFLLGFWLPRLVLFS
jgi:hypothetical protein